MTIAVTGAGGFIGSNLTGFFEREGHQLIKIERKLLFENIEQLTEIMEDSDVVVHLGGAPILQRWTKNNKKEIRDSRVISGRNIYYAIMAARRKPEIIFFCSAVGIYSNYGKHNEISNDFDRGFTGELVKEWEESAHSVRELGVRTVIMRLGIVLGDGGGALRSMITPFRYGFGAVIAGGKQMISFIHIFDVYLAMRFLMEKSEYNGIVNFVSPFPVTNRKFAKTLASVLNRPCYFNIPSFVMKILYGSASVMVTKGQNVVPGVLNRLGYKFRYPSIVVTLKNIIAE